MTKKIKRMHQPLDTLAKRQCVYIGYVFHKYHEFPGDYYGSLPNEYPNSENAIPRIDMGYHVKIGDKFFFINNEDETKVVDENTLLKLDGYKVLLEYAFNVPVISTITTPLPLSQCKKSLKKSPTQELRPIIRSYKTPYPEKILSTVTDKVENNITLSEFEALEIVMLPKRFTSGHGEVLDKVCHLLKNAKVENDRYKQELILEMKCIIHYYAETLDDIDRLEKVIGMKEAKSAMDFFEETLINRGKEEGKQEGRLEGRFEGRLEGLFEAALKIKRKLGIKAALEISDFTLEELESETVNRPDFIYPAS